MTNAEAKRAAAYAVQLQAELAAAYAKANDASKPAWKRICWQKEAAMLAASAMDVAYLSHGYTLADLGLTHDDDDALFF